MSGWLARVGLTLSWAVAATFAAPSSSPRQSSPPAIAADRPQAAVQPISIRVDAPARVGFPVWVHANLRGVLKARYPFGEDPRYFGSNRLELQRDGRLLPPMVGLGPSEQLIGSVVGSMAPDGAPENRLPLHLGFAIDTPGRYSVRWSVFGDRIEPRSLAVRPERLLAQSTWIDFRVLAARPSDHEAWLTGLLAAPPADAGAYTGDYLPSLLAAVSDRRVARAAMSGTYSRVHLIASCALGSLSLFPAEVATPLTLESLRRRGPSGDLAYFVSWHATWFQDRREEIVRTAISFLRSKDDAAVVGALQMLTFARGFDWRHGAAPLHDADRAVAAAAPALMIRSDPVAHALAIYLGGSGDAEAREPLTQLITKHPTEFEQATIALRWIDETTKPKPPLSEESPIRAAVRQLQFADGATRQAAAQALLDLASRSPQDMSGVGAELVNNVIRTHAEVNADPWRDAALILGRLHHRLTTVLALYLERDGATAALIDLGEPAVPIVTDILNVGGPVRRRLAAEVLGAIGGTAARDALSAALKTESDGEVKKAMQTALSQLGRRPPAADFR